MFDEVVRQGVSLLHLDGQLRRMRAALHPVYRRERIDGQNLRLLIGFALAEDSNCIDVGAYRGDILSQMVRAAPRGRHIAYEPLPFMHEYLVRQFPSVDVRRAAVSDRDGPSEFQYVRNLPGHSGLRQRSYPRRAHITKLTVRTESLDSSLPRDYVPTLIKIDVEGGERQVIEGAINLIRRHQPIVVFEHGRGAADKYGTSPRQIYELLCDVAKLRIYDLDGAGPFRLTQFDAIYRTGSRWNFVAHR